jgi:hypothetical protein
VTARQHLGVTLPGTLRTELRLYRQAIASAPGAACEEDLVAAYVIPAIEVVATWADRCPDPATRPGEGGERQIPRRIYQFWDAPVRPSWVLERFASWAAAEGWEHRDFDRHTAKDWLASTFGPDHARAFGLANHVAEQADFFRLCILLVEGGLYADADDRLVGAPDALLAGRGGLVVWREPLGTLANNVICTAPGHPVIASAVEMALASLLSRENDLTWTKTGPGLLTRAVALHVLRDAEGAARDTCILPEHHLLRYVATHLPAPYKSGARSWKMRANRGASRSAKAALEALAFGKPATPAQRTGRSR